MAVNLLVENAMLFKTHNSKLEFWVALMTVQNLWTFGSETDFPTVSYISDELRKDDLEELGIDLSESALSDIQKKQSENLLLSYADVFSKVKRDIGKCS